MNHLKRMYAKKIDFSSHAFQNIAHHLGQKNVNFGGGVGLKVALHLSYFDQIMMFNYFQGLNITFVDC